MSAKRLATYKGIDGVWLTNRSAEAFVSARPYPRVVAFRSRGGTSPFRVSTADQFYGIRSWYLEPVQVDESPLPALQPAEIKRTGPRALRLTSAPAEAAGLRLIMEIALDDRRPELTVRHGFTNLRRKTRRLAAWSIMAFPHRGVGLMPWATAETTTRSYLFFPGVDITEPCLRMGRNAAAVDFRIPTRQGWVKTGANTDAGWAAYLGNGQAWVSAVPHVPGAEYPEGGGTVTLYSSGKKVDQGFCEVENVGPFTDTRPGQTVWLEQRVTIVDGVPLRSGDPDAWFAALQERRA
jgi:hypothetical protein